MLNWPITIVSKQPHTEGMSMFLIERDGTQIKANNWDDVQSILQTGDSVFRWVPNLGWVEV